jgi:hypothetical protein
VIHVAAIEREARCSLSRDAVCDSEARLKRSRRIRGVDRLSRDVWPASPVTLALPQVIDAHEQRVD